MVLFPLTWYRPRRGVAGWQGSSMLGYTGGAGVHRGYCGPGLQQQREKMCKLQQSRELDTRCAHSDDSYGLNTVTAFCLYCQQIRWEILPKGKREVSSNSLFTSVIF